MLSFDEFKKFFIFGIGAGPTAFDVMHTDGIEFFREPDAQLGFLFAGATMGQLLCAPMIAAGIVILIWAGRAHERA